MINRRRWGGAQKRTVINLKCVVFSTVGGFWSNANGDDSIEVVDFEWVARPYWKYLTSRIF
jgi:hypothetical protein